MPVLQRTYSGAAVNCSFTGIWGTITFGGVSKTGLGQITVRMDVDHAIIEGGMDGAPINSYRPGEWGDIEIEVFQNSTTHQLLIQAYNDITAATSGGDPSNTFTGTLVIQELNGSSHTCTGVAFMKLGDKPYGNNLNGFVGR